LKGSFITSKDTRLSFDLYVRKEQHVWIQPLHDDHNNRQDPYMLFLGMRSADGKVVNPQFPTDYSYWKILAYSKMAYLFKLKAGKYTIELESYDNYAYYAFEARRDWCLRVFGEDVLILPTV